MQKAKVNIAKVNNAKGKSKHCESKKMQSKSKHCKSKQCKSKQCKSKQFSYWCVMWLVVAARFSNQDFSIPDIILSCSFEEQNLECNSLNLRLRFFTWWCRSSQSKSRHTKYLGQLIYFTCTGQVTWYSSSQWSTGWSASVQQSSRATTRRTAGWHRTIRGCLWEQTSQEKERKERGEDKVCRTRLHQDG